MFCWYLSVGAVHAAEWAKTYQATVRGTANSVQLTADGGYIVAGWMGVRPLGSLTRNDVWVMKVDAIGDVTWQKTYGGTGDDRASSVQSTPDGGYIVAGQTYSFGSRLGNAWVMKLDTNGNITWQQLYGGSSRRTIASAVQPTADGGYIVAGNSYDSSSASASGPWVLKLDASGNIIWQNTYRDTRYGYSANSVQQTADGGYIVAGDADLIGSFHVDAWVLKLDAGGNVAWQKAYGGPAYDRANSARSTSDGGYIVAGYTMAFGSRNGDAWVWKLDASGNIAWQKTYFGPPDAGNTKSGNATSVQPTVDGGYIVAGYTSSIGAGAPGDAWVLKLGASGDITWQKAYGGLHQDIANAMQLTADGGYVVVGETLSFGSGRGDAWVLKLDADGAIPGCPIAGTPNLVSADVDATTVDTTATAFADSASPVASTATPVNFDAAPVQQCFSGAPVATAIPTLSEWSMILMSGLLGLCAAIVIRRDRTGGVDSCSASGATRKTA